MGKGQNIPAPTGGFSIPRTAIFFPEESFILISVCYSVEYGYVANVVNSQHWLILVAQILPRLRIRMFLGLLDPNPNPLVRGRDPQPGPAHDIKQK